MSSLSLNWLWGRSIRWQLIGGVAILHTLLMMVFIIGLIRWQEHSLLRKAQAEVQSEATLLATIAQQASSNHDLSQARALLADISKNGVVRDAMLTDEAGAVLARFDESNHQAFLNEAQTQTVLHGPAVTRVFHETINTETAAAPVIVDGKTIGWAWVKNDLSQDQLSLRQVSLAGLLYTLLAAGVGTLFARILAGSILRPLRLLQDGVARFAADRLDEPIPITCLNEVGMVSRAFNAAMERLAHQQRQLHDEMDERARTQEELAKLYKVAAESNRAKDQFLAVLSHELRTPLTPVLTLAQMLERDVSLPESAREDISTIRRNVELEARLIDDLLDLTRIERGKVELRIATVDLHEKLREVARLCQGEADAKSLDVKLELWASDSKVRGDAARLAQVFWNLLQNAIKFTPAGGWISIQTHLKPRLSAGALASDNDLIVEVADSGIGIESALLSRIFDPFEQGSREITRIFGGLGLGLTISRALADLHGGELKATSEGVDRGSTFTVCLPLVAVSPVRAPVPQIAPASGKKRQILLVEDHLDTARLTAHLLTNVGYEVQTAQTVARAIQLARSKHFDLIVSDIGLPDGTGHELIRQLVAEAPLHNLKGIAISGLAREEDVKRSHDAGFINHLVKPVDPQALLDVVEEALHTPDSR